jgi:signal transduction histidine kinase
MFNLKERARSTGSTFTLDGAPGKGTRAVLAVPLK